MGRLRVTLACGRYDRTWPLYDGRVIPDGIDLNYIAMQPEEMFWRMARYGDFDVSEFSLCAYTILLGRGDRKFVAIPVFPSRFFRHSSIYINVNSGIRSPEDLRGKKIGIPDYTMTAGVWIRGLLEHDFGLKPTAFEWFIGGLDEPGRKQRVSTRPIEGLSITDIGNKTLSEMLEMGEIHALIGGREPRCFRDRSAHVRRLWQNYREVEQDYFRRTGIFPIMHTVVMRRELYEGNRWLAQSLFKAFVQSKEICRQEMASQSALRYSLPWMIRELEDTVSLMGEDYWAYGLEENRKTLDTFVGYCMDQGLIGSLVKGEELFAVETLDGFKT